MRKSAGTALSRYIFHRVILYTFFLNFALLWWFRGWGFGVWFLDWIFWGWGFQLMGFGTSCVGPCGCFGPSRVGAFSINIEK